MEDVIAPGVPLYLPSKGQMGLLATLNSDRNGRISPGPNQYVDQLRGLALQWLRIYSRSVKVYRNHTLLAQPLYLFAQNLPGR